MVGTVARTLIAAVVVAQLLVTAAAGHAQGATGGQPGDTGAATGSSPSVSLAAQVQPLGVCPQTGEVATAFDDTAGNTHVQAIECLVWAGITQGVSTEVFDPAGAVTRGQMASFLVRMVQAHGVELDAATPALTFADVQPGSAHADAIAQLVGAGLTQGVDAQRFAPAATVTRGQMASFLTRTVELIVAAELAADPSGFDDIATSTHRVAIDKAATAGLAAGVSADRFEPAREVRRDQMAAFVARTLSYLAVNDPASELPRGLLDDAPPRTPGAADDRPGTVDFELDDRTIEVEAPEDAQLDDTTLTIAVDELEQPQVGSYLVGYASDALPSGLHHRVSAVEQVGSNWVIDVEPADLWEPYEQLELDVTVEPDETSMAQLVDAINDQATTATAPVFTAALDVTDPSLAQLANEVPSRFRGPQIELTLSEPHPRRIGQVREGITLFEDTSTGERVWLHLRMALRPTVDLAFDGGGWFSGPDYALVAMRLDADVDVGIKGTSQAEASCDLAGDADPDDRCAQRIRDNLGRALALVPDDPLELLADADRLLRLRQLADRFPTTVSIEPTFPLALEVTGDGLLEASLSSWVVVGAEYRDGEGLTGIIDYPDQPTLTVNGEATVTARAEAGIGIKVLIANTFGPTITGSAFSEIAGGATRQRLSVWPRPVIDTWSRASVGLNVKAEVGVQDPVFGRLSTSWTVYDDDPVRYDVHRSMPGAPQLRATGEVQGNALPLAWTEPTHADRYIVAAGPNAASCRAEATRGTRPNGAQRLLRNAQTPAVVTLPAVTWDEVHLCVAAVDGTLARVSDASTTVVIDIPPPPDEPLTREVLPGIEASLDSYRSGQWADQDQTGAWHRIQYTGDSDRSVWLQARRLPGWWAAEALIDAIETGQDTAQGFEGVRVRDLGDDPRFPDASRAIQVTADPTTYEGFDNTTWATGDLQWFLLDHGDHVVHIEWDSSVGFDGWQVYDGTPVTIDPAGRDLMTTIRVTATGTASLPDPVDPRSVDWANATIEYRPQRGTGIAHDWPLTDGTFEGVSPGGQSTYRITLLDVAYGDAVGDNGLDALLLLDSTATGAPFGMVMTQQPDGSWRQLDIADGSLTSDVERLVATSEILFPVRGDGRPGDALFWQPAIGLFAGVG